MFVIKTIPDRTARKFRLRASASAHASKSSKHIYQKALEGSYNTALLQQRPVVTWTIESDQTLTIIQWAISAPTVDRSSLSHEVFRRLLTGLPGVSLRPPPRVEISTIILARTAPPPSTAAASATALGHFVSVWVWVGRWWLHCRPLPGAPDGIWARAPVWGRPLVEPSSPHGSGRVHGAPHLPPVGQFAARLPPHHSVAIV